MHRADVPMLAGIRLGVETLASGEGGTAAAALHRMECLA
jgi:hypothetical protein